MKRGPKPKGNALRTWSSDVAYAVGLFTADGCMQKDGRHLDFTSTDKKQVETFISCLKLRTKVGIKISGNGRRAYRVQFSDVLFYRFLAEIGLSPAKSKIIRKVDIPDIYFRDFLRGLFDGDGTTYAHYDSVFKRSFRFYISFASASPEFIRWLQSAIRRFLPVTGSVSRTKATSYSQLRFSKEDAVRVAKYMYWKPSVPKLRRKHLKISRSMRIIGTSRRSK